MAASKLLLSILRTEYETAALGEWATSRRADLEDCTEAGYTTSEGARYAVFVHIGRMDLVIEGCFRGTSGSVRCCGRTGRAARMGTAQSTPRGLNSEKGRSIGLQRWPQAPRDGCGGLDFEQDWTDHRPISRSSVKPRKAGDCMMNESWQEPGGAEISCGGPGQHTAIASGKADVWTRPAQFRQAGARGLPLKPLNLPPLNIPHIPHIPKLVCSLPTSFRDGCP